MNDTLQDSRHLFCTTLRILGYEKKHGVSAGLSKNAKDQWHMYHPGGVLDPNMFSSATHNSKMTESILWFLFMKLDAKQACEVFQGCWPILERAQSREFRNIAFKWLEQLKKEGKIPSDVLIRKSFLDDGRGERFEKLIHSLSNLVLIQTIEKEFEVKIPNFLAWKIDDHVAKSILKKNCERELDRISAQIGELVALEEQYEKAKWFRVKQFAKLAAFEVEMNKKQKTVDAFNLKSYETKKGEYETAIRNICSMLALSEHKSDTLPYIISGEFKKAVIHPVPIQIPQEYIHDMKEYMTKNSISLYSAGKLNMISFLKLVHFLDRKLGLMLRKDHLDINDELQQKFLDSIEFNRRKLEAMISILESQTLESKQKIQSLYRKVSSNGSTFQWTSNDPQKESNTPNPVLVKSHFFTEAKTSEPGSESVNAFKSRLYHESIVKTPSVDKSLTTQKSIAQSRFHCQKKEIQSKNEKSISKLTKKIAHLIESDSEDETKIKRPLVQNLPKENSTPKVAINDFFKYLKDSGFSTKNDLKNTHTILGVGKMISERTKPIQSANNSNLITPLKERRPSNFRDSVLRSQLKKDSVNHIPSQDLPHSPSFRKKHVSEKTMKKVAFVEETMNTSSSISYAKESIHLDNSLLFEHQSLIGNEHIFSLVDDLNAVNLNSAFDQLTPNTTNRTVEFSGTPASTTKKSFLFGDMTIDNMSMIQSGHGKSYDFNESLAFNRADDSIQLNETTGNILIPEDFVEESIQLDEFTRASQFNACISHDFRSAYMDPLSSNLDESVPFEESMQFTYNNNYDHTIYIDAEESIQIE